MPQYKQISELSETTDLTQNLYTIVYDSEGNSRKVNINSLVSLINSTEEEIIGTSEDTGDDDTIKGAKAFAEERITAVTPDWNCNDETNTSYIQHRTHYIGDTEYSNSSSVTLSISGNYAFAQLYGDGAYPSGFTSVMQVGATMKVTVGNTTYEGTVQGDGSRVWIGNGYIMSSSCEDTGEDYCIGTQSLGYDYIRLYVDSSLEGTYDEGDVVIKFVGTEIHQLDEQYIPDTIARTANVIQKVSGATNGHVATLNENGEVVDSGKALSALANDTDVVHKTGAETVSGVKTFTNGVIVGSCTIAYDSDDSCLTFSF